MDVEQNREKNGEKPLTIFTDGGAKNNGKKSCIAAWAVFFDDETGVISQPSLMRYNEAGRIFSEPSNQKAELYAIKSALEKALHICENKEIPIVETIQIVTDSQYSIDCLTKWCKNWEKNGWRTYKGEKVKHDIIIKESLKSMEELKRFVSSVELKHVNSHLIAPKDSTSKEYLIWYGNYKVDKMVAACMNNATQNESSFHMPKGKMISIDWDGTMLESNEKTEKKKSSDEAAITVTW